MRYTHHGDLDHLGHFCDHSFNLLRAYVLTGFFSDPADGGNKNQIGWKLIGFKDDFYYAPPFGYYDAELLKEKGEKA